MSQQQVPAVKCPGCGADRFSWSTSSQLYTCQACHRPYTQSTLFASPQTPAAAVTTPVAQACSHPFWKNLPGVYAVECSTCGCHTPYGSPIHLASAGSPTPNLSGINSVVRGTSPTTPTTPTPAAGTGTITLPAGFAGTLTPYLFSGRTWAAPVMGMNSFVLGGPDEDAPAIEVDDPADPPTCRLCDIELCAAIDTAYDRALKGLCAKCQQKNRDKFVSVRGHVFPTPRKDGSLYDGECALCAYYADYETLYGHVFGQKGFHDVSEMTECDEGL